MIIKKLLGFLVKSVLLAETTVLLDLHTVRHGLLFLCGIVVALLALCAGKSNLGTHCFSSEIIK